MNIQVTSVLEKNFYDDLEELFFFHPQQEAFRRNILESVERYGIPEIVEHDGGLRIHLKLLDDVQTLYAVAQREESRELVGAVVYTRTPEGVLDILHIAVKDEYTLRGMGIDESVAILLIDELCRIGRRIQGVHTVRLAYNRGKVILKPVHAQAPKASESHA